jgi:hypothetical protein
MDRLVGTLKSILEARPSPPTQILDTIIDSRFETAAAAPLEAPAAPNDGREHAKEQLLTLEARRRAGRLAEGIGHASGWALVWAIAAVVGFTLNMTIIESAQGPLTSVPALYVVQLEAALVAAVVAFLLATRGWLRKQSPFYAAMWIGFSSMTLAIHGGNIATGFLEKGTPDIVFATVLMVATLLQWMIWRRRDKTHEAH